MLLVDKPAGDNSAWAPKNFQRMPPSYARSPLVLQTTESPQSLSCKATRPYQILIEPNITADLIRGPLADGVRRNVIGNAIGTSSPNRIHKTAYSPTPSLWRPTRSLLKPYGCLRVGCPRTFTNLSALLLHANRGNCGIPEELSHLTSSPSESTSTPVQTRVIANESPTTKSAPGSFFKKLKLSSITKLSGRLKNTQQNHQSHTELSVSANDNVRSMPTDTRRGRNNLRARRPTSAPDPSKPFTLKTSSPPSQLIQFPPPPPFDARTTSSANKQKRSEHNDLVHQKEETGRKYLRGTQVHCSRGHMVLNGPKDECSECAAGGHRLRSRSLSSSRLSERDPVLSRPYSRPSSRTFLKSLSIDTSCLKPLSPASSSYSISVLLAPDLSSPVPSNAVASSSRLAKPLPMFPQHRSDQLIRQRKLNSRQKARYVAHEDAHFTSIGMYPRRVSSSSSFDSSIFTTPRLVSPQSFSRLSVVSPKLSRPSSLYSSRSSLSISSSIRRLSNAVPAAPSSGASRSAKRTSASFLPSWQFSPPPFVILEDHDDAAQAPPTNITSDIPKEKIRQGFWNQRGDFLTADEFIVYAPPDRRYPEELKAYPPPGIGFRDHNMEFILHSPIPELPESIPMAGSSPEQPYDSVSLHVHVYLVSRR